MSELHNGWKMVKFGDVVRNVRETADPYAEGIERYVGLGDIEPENLHIRSWGLVEKDGTTFTRRFRAGQVLFAKRRAYQRKAALADFDGVCSHDLLVFEAIEEHLLPELLPFIVQTDAFYEKAIATSAGSLSPRTKWRDLARYEFVLPPLDEQRRIAEILWAADDVVESHTRSLGEIQKLVGAYLDSLIRQDAYPRTRVGEVAKFTSGRSINVTSLGDYSPNTPIPVYGGNGIAGYTEHPLDDALEPVVVIGRVGQQCGVTFITDGPSWITDNALYSALLSEEVSVTYLGILLKAARLNQDKIGNYLPLVNQQVVHGAKIPLPPKDMQEALVGTYHQIIEVVNGIESHTTRSRELSARLREAFISPIESH